MGSMRMSSQHLRYFVEPSLQLGDSGFQITHAAAAIRSASSPSSMFSSAIWNASTAT